MTDLLSEFIIAASNSEEIPYREPASLHDRFKLLPIQNSYLNELKKGVVGDDSTTCRQFFKNIKNHTLQ